MNKTTAWRVLLVALIPAVALHELTHAAVAYHWADVSLEWREDVSWYLQPALRARIENWRPGTPWPVMMLSYIAPLLIGYTFAGLTLIALGLGLEVALSLEVAVALAVNWVWYTGASAGDLKPVAAAVRSARAYHGGDAHGY